MYARSHYKALKVHKATKMWENNPTKTHAVSHIAKKAVPNISQPRITRK